MRITLHYSLGLWKNLNSIYLSLYNLKSEYSMYMPLQITYSHMKAISDLLQMAMTCSLHDQGKEASLSYQIKSYTI